MKTLLSTIALIITLSFSICVKAQRKSTAKSLLWEVSGKDLSKPSYIYGTIHMICEPDFVLQAKTTRAFSSSDELVLELNFTDPAEMAAIQKTMMSPEPLSKKLSPAQYKKIDAVLSLKTGASLKAMEQFTMAAISSFMISKTLPCKEIKSYEMEFASFADQQKKSVAALETVKEQTDFFAKAFSDDDLVNQIAAFDDYKNVFGETIIAYKSEDLDKLAEILKDKRFGNTAESDKWMLQVRNVNWAKQMPHMMKNKGCFFAVGAGHLPGKEGILQLLRDKGYTVKPILN